MASTSKVKEVQLELCQGFGVEWRESPEDLKVGISRNFQSGEQPINGLRHPPEADTTGWYAWAGEELSRDPDFFVPVHVRHLAELCPQVLGYLGLPPGWRFLRAPGQEDVWEDPSLLDL